MGMNTDKYSQLATHLFVLEFYHTWVVNVNADWQVVVRQLDARLIHTFIYLQQQTL